jgi:hypothetical protein
VAPRFEKAAAPHQSNQVLALTTASFTVQVGLKIARDARVHPVGARQKGGVRNTVPYSQFAIVPTADGWNSGRDMQREGWMAAFLIYHGPVCAVGVRHQQIH